MAESHAAPSKPPRIKPNEAGNRATVKVLVREQLQQDELLESLVDEPYTMEDGSDGPGFIDLQEYYSNILSKPQPDVVWALEAIRKDLQEGIMESGDRLATKPRTPRKPQPRPKAQMPVSDSTTDEKKKVGFERVKSSPLLPSVDPPKPLRRSTHSASNLQVPEKAPSEGSKAPPKPQRRSTHGMPQLSIQPLPEQPKAAVSRQAEPLPQPPMQQRSLPQPPLNTSNEKQTPSQSAIQQRSLPAPPTNPPNQNHASLQPPIKQRSLPLPPTDTSSEKKKEEKNATENVYSNEIEYEDVNFKNDGTKAPQSGDGSQQQQDEKKKKASFRHSLSGKLGKLKVKGSTINVDVTDEGEATPSPKPTAAASANSQDWSAQNITLKPEQLIQIMQMVKEGKCTQEEAIARMKQEQMQKAVDVTAQQENQESNSGPSESSRIRVPPVVPEENVDTTDSETKAPSATNTTAQEEDDETYMDMAPGDKLPEDMITKRSRTMTLKGKLSGFLAHRKNMAEEGAEGEESIDGKVVKKGKKSSKLGFFNKKGEKEAGKEDETVGVVCEYVNDSKDSGDGSRDRTASSGSLSGAGGDSAPTTAESPNMVRNTKALAGLRNVISRRNAQKDEEGAAEKTAGEKKPKSRSQTSDSAPKSGDYVAKAVVEMPFKPGAYDKESLELEVGDVINVISMPDHGTWSGELNGKVGNFKFIYVTITEQEQEKGRSRQRVRKSAMPPAPASIQDMLEQLSLPAEYHDLFVVNGYDDISFIKDIDNISALTEIGITNSAHQEAILFMVDVLNTEDSSRDFSLSKRSSRLLASPTDQPSVPERKSRPTSPKGDTETPDGTSQKQLPKPIEEKMLLGVAPVAARRSTVGANWKESRDKATAAKAAQRPATRLFSDRDLPGKAVMLPVLPKGKQLPGLGKSPEEDPSKRTEKKKPLKRSSSLKEETRDVPTVPSHEQNSPLDKQELLLPPSKNTDTTDGSEAMAKQQAPVKLSSPAPASGSDGKKAVAHSVGEATTSDTHGSHGNTALPMRGIQAPPPPTKGKAETSGDDVKESKAKKRQAPPPPTVGATSPPPTVSATDKDSKPAGGEGEGPGTGKRVPVRQAPLPDAKQPARELQSSVKGTADQPTSAGNDVECQPTVSKPEEMKEKSAPPKPERRGTSAVKPDRGTPPKPTRPQSTLPAETTNNTDTALATNKSLLTSLTKPSSPRGVKACEQTTADGETSQPKTLSAGNRQNLDNTDGRAAIAEVPKKSPRASRRFETSTKSPPPPAARPKPPAKPPVATKALPSPVKLSQEDDSSQPPTPSSTPADDGKTKAAVQAKIAQDKIKLTAAPYSGRDGRGAIPLGLVQRYAVECRLPAKQVASCLEQLRQEVLTQAGRSVVATEPCNTEQDWKEMVKKTSLSAWLTSIGLPMYTDILLDNGYEIDSINELTSPDLQSYGVTDPRHVKRLLDCAQL